MLQARWFGSWGLSLMLISHRRTPQTRYGDRHS
jgi:hypothetical protein